MWKYNNLLLVGIYGGSCGGGMKGFTMVIQRLWWRLYFMLSYTERGVGGQGGVVVRMCDRFVWFWGSVDQGLCCCTFNKLIWWSFSPFFYVRFVWLFCILFGGIIFNAILWCYILFSFCLFFYPILFSFSTLLLGLFELYTLAQNNKYRNCWHMKVEFIINKRFI